MSVLIHPQSNASPQRISSASQSRFAGQLLALCIFTIAAISALDIWFAVSNPIIMIVEKNPVCLALMQFDPSGLRYFVAGKSLGTVMVLLSLWTLHRFAYKHTSLIAVWVTLFQVSLLIYLTLSDPHINGLPNFGLLFQETRESIWDLGHDFHRN